MGLPRGRGRGGMVNIKRRVKGRSSRIKSRSRKGDREGRDISGGSTNSHIFIEVNIIEELFRHDEHKSTGGRRCTSGDEISRGRIVTGKR